VGCGEALSFGSRVFRTRSWEMTPEPRSAISRQTVKWEHAAEGGFRVGDDTAGSSDCQVVQIDPIGIRQVDTVPVDTRLGWLGATDPNHIARRTDFAPLLVFGKIQITNLLPGIHDSAKRLVNERLFHFLSMNVAYLKIVNFK